MSALFLSHINKRKVARILLTVLMIPLIILAFPTPVNTYEFPTFVVILDPGHGGVCKRPMSLHGDRYDSISGTYLDVFKEGASFRGLHEKDIVYNIAKKAEQYLLMCRPGGDNHAFYQLLKEFTDEDPERVNIIVHMGRGKSITEEEADSMTDPNAEFRLFDYPGPDGTLQPGRLSRMNRLKPHLIVALHLAEEGPRDYHGISPVIAVPYSLLYNGFRYLKGDKSAKKKMDMDIIRNWFCEDGSRKSFQWFLNDVSLYFTGYPLDKNNKVDNDFRGYRYNMVTWDYRDYDDWEYIARSHPAETRYAKEMKEFVPDGKFWVREQSIYEKYRREGGPEGFGGDNAYASYEIARYILYSLHQNSKIEQKAGKSYNNIWILPLHVNAVTAFLELGYLRRAKDRLIMTQKQDDIAKGIAVGIYSLFTGIKLRDDKFKFIPKGKKINFHKYQINESKSYFSDVVE